MPRYSLVALFALQFAVTARADKVEGVPSPVARRIEAAEKRVQADPKSPAAYNDLAFALCRSARDSGDLSAYDKADAALRRSLELSRGNYEARKLQIVVLLGKRRYTDALKQASELQSHHHDDTGIWALLVDANIGLLNVEEAERDAQWILDLRSGSSVGFTKAALVREMTGDPEGAIDFYEEALRRTAQADGDERAWLLTQTARLQMKRGNARRAEALLDEALKIFPDSRQALTAIAALSGTKPPAQ